MERPLHVDPEDERGAGHADDEDVQTNEDPGPEMNLEQRLAQENRLWSMEECLHERSAPLTCPDAGA